jgi:hypothetical protein
MTSGDPLDRPCCRFFSALIACHTSGSTAQIVCSLLNIGFGPHRRKELFVLSSFGCPALGKRLHKVVRLASEIDVIKTNTSLVSSLKIKSCAFF